MKSAKDIKVIIKRDEAAKDLPLPHYATDGASGMDLYAAVKSELTIKPGDIKLIPTGIYLSIPPCYEAEIRPRSGLALKHGITLVNSPGTIDSDYRGELKIILFNFSKEDFIIKRGDRIAQMVVAEVIKAGLIEASELNSSERGEGGFGHTGKS